MDEKRLNAQEKMKELLQKLDSIREAQRTLDVNNDIVEYSPYLSLQYKGNNPLASGKSIALGSELRENVSKQVKEYFNKELTIKQEELVEVCRKIVDLYDKDPNNIAKQKLKALGEIKIQ